MRAMRIHTLGEPMTLDEVPVPEPGPGEVRLKILACGVNFADTLIVKGLYQEKHDPPFIPGAEVCGEVDALGEGVDTLKPGDRVVSLIGMGGFGEFALSKAVTCAPVPEAMSDEEAAAFMIVYGTSHLALDHRAHLQPGENLLVLGAAGGVGLTAVEIGKLMGANVIACARGDDRLEIARQKGADHLINTDKQDIRDTVKALGGADVVYDPVGGDQWKAALRATNWEGRLLPIGFASGEIPQIPANILLVKNISVLGLYWGAYGKFGPDIMRKSNLQLLTWYAEGKLKPHVSNTLTLADANEALTLLSTRKATGKVVVKPA